MAGYGQDDFYNQGQGFYDNSQSYDVGSEQFPQDQQFGQFDYNQPQAGYASPPPQYAGMSQGYTGTIMTPDPSSYAPETGVEDYENEPPLMEELGINFDHIVQKTVSVLNPLYKPEPLVTQDSDLAGPLVFCLAFGGSLLLAGKVQFGYVYGIGVIGCLAIYALLNLMSMQGVSSTCVISVLGYCLLPMVILSFCAVVISLKGIMGIVLTSVTVIWCSLSASKLFVSALSLDHQQPLVAYPCALVYAVFALLTVF